MAKNLNLRVTHAISREEGRSQLAHALRQRCRVGKNQRWLGTYYKLSRRRICELTKRFMGSFYWAYRGREGWQVNQSLSSGTSEIGAINES